MVKIKTVFSICIMLNGAFLWADSYSKIAKTMAVSAADLKIKKIKVAIMPFSYIDGRQSISGKVIGERLTGAMVESGKFDLVERALITKLLTEQELALTGVIGSESAQKIGALTGAGAILTGTMNDLMGGRIEVNARLILTESGKIIASAKQELKKDWIDMTSEPGLNTQDFSQTQSEIDKISQSDAFKANEEGLQELKIAKLDDSISSFSKAIRLNPFLPVVYGNRGVAYFKKADYRKAIDDFSASIERDPTNAVTFNNLGVACLNLREFEKAINYLSKALELAPDYADAYSNRGDAFFMQSFFEKALKDYTRAIEIDPAHLKSWTNRGSTYFRIGDLQKALADYSNAIETDPDSVEPYINRGFVNFDLKKYDNAVNDFSGATKKDAKAKEAYAGLGISYLKLGKTVLAKTSFKKAIALNYRYKDKISALASEGHFYTPIQMAAFREIQLALK